MKGYRILKLEQMLTESINGGNDERMEEIERRIEQKEKSLNSKRDKNKA